MNDNPDHPDDPNFLLTPVITDEYVFEFWERSGEKLDMRYQVCAKNIKHAYRIVLELCGADWENYNTIINPVLVKCVCRIRLKCGLGEVLKKYEN